jgi:membrane-associated phospholipid phosphatase
VPKSSARPRWLLPVLVIALILPLAYFLPYWPVDLTVARALQHPLVGPAPASLITSAATRPAVYVLLGLGLLVATWRGRLRGLVVTGVLMALWWYAGEPLKEVIHRPRPTPALVEVVRPSSGYSFPSTFATTWFSAWLPIAVYAWRTRQRQAGTVLAVVAVIAILLGAWARIRMGAHWPSDLLMTFGLVWATFTLIELAVDRLDG